MTNYISLNGTPLPADQPIFTAGNKGIQYGDALFETMRVWKGRIILEQYHLDRLREGIRLLELDIPTPIQNNCKEAVAALCHLNGHSNARVRLTVFMNGDQPAFTVESWPLDTPYIFNEPGLEIDIFPHAFKSIDHLSAAKTTNRLLYRLAARHEREGLECLVLNTQGTICDSTISNIFWLHGEDLYTTPLRHGCVDGIMRRHLLTSLPVSENILDEDVLMQADEVFLTNAIRGIRPVKNFRHRQYATARSRKIFKAFVEPLCP